MAPRPPCRQRNPFTLSFINLIRVWLMLYGPGPRIGPFLLRCATRWSGGPINSNESPFAPRFRDSRLRFWNHPLPVSVDVAFGPARVYNVTLPLELDSQPFATVRVGVSTGYLPPLSNPANRGNVAKLE
jgi:hypothetical protein